MHDSETMLQENHGFTPLSGSDARQLLAATGWLELGDHDSAFDETCEIHEETINHPDVLLVRFRAYAAGRKFENCEVVASALMKIAPSWRQSVICICSAVHWLGNSEQAYDKLKQHEGCEAWNWHCHYDLACYAAVTGRTDEARKRLEAAFDSVEDKAWLKALALNDPDLESIWVSGN